MPRWTKEQMDAINISGTNIIVSAGAGSGKTAVLTERVIEKLKKGIKINELLILTFTNAAAGEMKERIRNKINENKELLDNLELLEESYITTFDSYTLSLVKKYNYILNVSNNLNIIDNGIINILKEEFLEEIFNDLYLSKDKRFLKLINDFCIKNDTLIKKAIIKIYNNLDLLSNKEEYLNNYIDNYLNIDKINEYIIEYNNLIKEELSFIEDNLILISENDNSDYYDKLSVSLEKLLKSNSYNEVLKNINVNISRRPKNSEDIKKYKDNIDNSLKIIKSYLRFNSEEEIKESFNIMKEYIIIIIDIIKRLTKKINDYKNKYDLYEFNDIELMAIKLLRENKNICDEIKNSFKEICVDEYQDTNDLQEEFINLIENNNVYMVGDIKQSIYGFRNANPKIFKNKYDRYNNLDGGIKIDLLKNFRSRNNVLEGINKIFSHIMDEDFGSALYKTSHQMIFGNNNYEENKNDKQNYDLEIYNYNYEGSIYNKEEIEAFIIGNDIINKINNKYQVIDKYSNKLRNCEYKDFCIIMDRKSGFNTYNKVFEYLKIPIQICEDKVLTNEIDLLLINNIIGYILKIKDNNKDTLYKYYFMSIIRSHLFSYNDNTIFEIINNNSYEDTELYKICKDISDNLDLLDNIKLIDIIVKKFKFYEKSILIGNVMDSIIRINNIYDIARNINNMGYTIYDFKDYLDKIINSNKEIKYKDSIVNDSSVKIMNIHKSKGLEFPICYFSGYHKEFNNVDIKDKFIYDKNYGIITPFFKDGIGISILKDLVKDRYFKDNISEQIRLFYVALTRAKEKIIIVTSLSEEESYTSDIVDYNIRRKYNSFLSMLNSINGNLKNNIKNINLDSINLTKNYIYINNKKLLSSIETDLINYKDIIINNDIKEELHASKEINSIISKKENDLLEYGTNMHKVFEYADFINLDNNKLYYDKIKEFVELLGINKDTLIYKEKEFVFEIDNISYHGIIDLVLVMNDCVKIVDYKLKNIDDIKYINQLEVYYKYIKSIFNKDVKTYLYSIINNELKEVIIKNN